MDVTFRRAHPTDIDNIMFLENATFVSDAWPRDTMLRELASPHCFYLVACVEAGVEPTGGGDVDPSVENGSGSASHERVVGYGGLLAAKGTESADIQTLAVARPWRSRGIGRVLLRALIAEAERRGAGAVFLEVRSDNTSAQALYRSAGFETIGTRKGYYQPDNVDAISMRCSLPMSAIPSGSSRSASRRRLAGEVAGSQKAHGATHNRGVARAAGAATEPPL